MPIKLNNGKEIPGIAFGTWKQGNGQETVDKVDQAIDTGFSHVDTAQIYRNEEEAGKAIKDSALSRDEIYITTKFSGMDGLDIETSIHNSLKNLGVSYVDLYLVHSPRLAIPDIPTIWAQMEAVQNAGFAKSIGVSNFTVDDLEILLDHAKIKPVANQIEFHPYAYTRQLSTVKYCAENDIVVEAYSPLKPLTQFPDGPVTKPVEEIAKRLDVQSEMVLLAWAKAKNTVVVTTSSKRERLEGYLDAGDITLSKEDIASIDAAGASGTNPDKKKKMVVVFVAYAIIGLLYMMSSSE